MIFLMVIPMQNVNNCKKILSNSDLDLPRKKNTQEEEYKKKSKKEEELN